MRSQLMRRYSLLGWSKSLMSLSTSSPLAPKPGGTETSSTRSEGRLFLVSPLHIGPITSSRGNKGYPRRVTATWTQLPILAGTHYRACVATTKTSSLASGLAQLATPTLALLRWRQQTRLSTGSSRMVLIGPKWTGTDVLGKPTRAGCL